VAEEGNTLIVADYGQLELRVLAHLADCKSMIKAFEEGGCFHSRTAVGMFPELKKAVDSGEVLLEWKGNEKPPVPLLKDMYAAHRRKAKVLNFSIAYGKTAHGLALDWGVSVGEAKKLLKAWYSDRPEVLKWQEYMRNLAVEEGRVPTIMGRYRMLPEATSKSRKLKQHSLRSAINSPVQGSAADIVMMAMIKMEKSEILKQLKWEQILQIHDEVILEGPKESMEEAMREVKTCMEQPWDHYGLFPMKVDLAVDAKSEDSWYKAK